MLVGNLHGSLAWQRIIIDKSAISGLCPNKCRRQLICCSNLRNRSRHGHPDGFDFDQYPAASSDYVSRVPRRRLKRSTPCLRNRSLNDFATELSEIDALAEFGLVHCANGTITVPEDARPLVRTICAVFDADLSNEETRYSRAV